MTMEIRPDTSYIFQVIADLYAKYDRWPTIQEFAGQLGIQVTEELAIEYNVLHHTFCELQEKIEEKRRAV